MAFRRILGVLLLLASCRRTSLYAAGGVPPVDERMNLDHTDFEHTPSTVRFHNDMQEGVSICWLPGRKFRDPCVPKPGTSEQSVNCICADVAPQLYHEMRTTVESKWVIKSAGGALVGKVVIFGGKHIYHLSSFLFNGTDHEAPGVYTSSTGLATLDLANTVHVHMPDDCTSQTGYDVLGPLWRDGLRTAAHRLNLTLCMCGDYNASTTYTAVEPSTSLPRMMPGDACGCGNGVRNHAEHGVWMHEDYLPDSSPSPLQRPLFNLYMPCSYTIICAQQLQLAVRCDGTPEEMARVLGGEAGSPATLDAAALARSFYSSLRINTLHTTVDGDRITLKNKLWTTLRRFYGPSTAGLIMPPTFHYEDADERAALHMICDNLVRQQLPSAFVMKDPNAHRQLGIQLASAENILSGQTFIPTKFTMATAFLADPFLIRGYKINIRRYLVAVCVRGRLRAYVHDDGKNIFTRKPYREPWVKDESPSTLGSLFSAVAGAVTGSAPAGTDWWTNEDAARARLEELITSGYVPATHFDDKPLSALEFDEYVRAHYVRPNTSLSAAAQPPRGADDAEEGVAAPLYRSMWTRLALVLHAARRDEMFDICSTRAQSRSPAESLEKLAAEAAASVRARAEAGAGASERSLEEEGEEESQRARRSAERDNLPHWSLANKIAEPGHGPLRRRYFDTPPCIETSVRYMHFGCDFHIDRALTGHTSRLFECNKGPDMSAHSYRDGKMKRGVAADIQSFIGFRGSFKGSNEDARKYRMNLIYDSDSFDLTAAVRSLHDLHGLADAQPAGGGSAAQAARASGVDGIPYYSADLPGDRHAEL